ncbi:MAG: PQQ-binding-like beta-propeller repeat protein, partial [Planctomycetes bacterium]|nr:PQQ-binding-like beta-propeller repeat protein [Planctomycetota bacterium]
MKTIHQPNSRWAPLLAIAICVLTGPVSAQFHTSKVSVPDDLVVRQHLTRAQDALKQDDAPRAIRIWQDILDRLAGKVVESHRAQRRGTETDAVIAGDRFRGVRARVMELIRVLPGEGVAHYGKMMEPKARRMLGDGVAREDERLLRECALRYLLTESGRGAHFALIDLLVEHGRFEEARVAVQRLRADLTEGELSGPFGIQILAREGLALWGAGRTADLKKTITRARKNANGKDIAVGADQIDVIAFLEALASRASGRPAGGTEVRPEIKVVRQRVWNRAFSRNTNTSGSTPMFGGRSRSHWVNHFPVVPKIEDGVVYYCDGRFLRARSLFTGNELWPGIPSLLPELSGQQNRNLHYHVVVDGDLVFGYVQGKPAMEGHRAWQGFEPIETIPAHKLVAVDRNTGELRWSHMDFTGRTPDETAFIERLTVNQPPLVIGDTLYAAGNVLMGVFHQWICAFDRATGHVKWKTYTGAGQMELNMFGNPVKEGVAGHVAEHEGVLYYSTNIGVICAVDAVTGTILWEAAYDQEGIPSTDSPITRERHPGWMPTAPAIVGDRVFVAPTDSMNLYACDKSTGELTRVNLGTRTVVSKNHYFLGAHNGLLLVAGKKITAIRSGDFGEEWSSVELGSQYDRAAIQGCPAVVGNDIIFCTTSGNATLVNRVDLRSGSFVKQERLRYSNREGNVIVSPDAIVIAGQQSIDAYFELKDVERRLDRATRKAGSDPELQMRLGDVRQRQGQWAQALQAYERALSRARAIGPRGRHVARRAALNLYNGWLKIADEEHRQIMGGPVSPEARYHKAIEYAQTEKQRVRALMACLDWSLREADDPAFNRTVTLLVEKHSEEWTELKGEIHGLFPELPQGTRMPSGLLALLAAGVRAEQSD